MRLFNAMQVTAAFVAWPFFISFLAQAGFRGATPALYAACAFYVIAFGAMVVCVQEAIK